MKQHLKTITLILSLLPFHAWADDIDSLQLFVESHPNEVSLNAMAEGSSLSLSSSDEQLLIRMQLAEPALQMRVLMQGMDVYVDPTGRKREKYAIIMPTAMDVRDMVPPPNEADIPESAKEGGEQVRPDLFPLIAALNMRGARIDINGRQQELSGQQFRIVLSRETGLIDYYILLPKEPFMNEKKLSSTWSIGLYADLPSDAGGPPQNMGGPGQEGPGQGGPGQGGPGQGPQGKQPEMGKVINEWHTFSIDEVDNVNASVGEEDMSAPAVSAQVNGDNITWTVTTTNPKHQLSFLMQGLTITAGSGSQNLTFRFPDARMVRDKVKRHPNEVKPTFTADSVGQETRPDLLPLITALNDTTATIDGKPTRQFNIALDRETTKLTFTATTAKGDFAGETAVSITSAPPQQMGREFTGNNLSNQPHQHQNPGGLGEAPQSPNDSSRNIEHKTTVIIN